MGLWIFLLIAFLMMGISALVYYYRKILAAVKYFDDGLSKLKKHLITTGIFILTLIPAYCSFVTWFILFLHFVVFLLLCDLAKAVVKRINKGKTIRYPGWIKLAYKLGAVALLLTCAVFVYGKYNMYHVVQTDYDVTVDKSLSRDYTIALIADLHYGISLDAGGLQTTAGSIEAVSPDFVILCGDVVDESTTLAQMKEAFSILGGIKARYGVYYVYGNHDAGTFRSPPNFTQDQLSQTIENCGITILTDESVLINDEILLIGRKDRQFGERMSIDELTKDADFTNFLLVADHQPNDYVNLDKAGCDMIVSGHTHGGQIFPFGVLGELSGANDMTYGYRKVGNLNAFVTSGIAGWGFDLRTEKHSEYVLIHIKGKQ
jgi:Predicted phosphohydrolases